MKKLLILLTVILAGCAGNDNMFKLDNEYMARRQRETRSFAAKNETEILSASSQVLQDMGYTLSESEVALGLITATKDREAGSTAGMVFAVVFGGKNATYDTQQKIYATLISTKSASGGYNVRIEFARWVWNNRGEIRSEKIQDDQIYKEFFDKLSQSIFLTANNI